MSALLQRGVVKFFRQDEGYGFLAPMRGGEDVFVHIRAIEASGIGIVTRGDILDYEVGRDRETGRNCATRLVSVKQGAARSRTPAEPSVAFRAVRQPESSADAGPFMGVVKWFDAARGFGFIRRDDGEDIFVHIAAVRRAELEDLAEGQAVSFMVVREYRTGRPAAMSLRFFS